MSGPDLTPTCQRFSLMTQPETKFLLDHKDLIHKELGLIQDVIKRMAANSFQVKAWLAGIITLLAAFEREKLFTDLRLMLVLLIPICVFRYLDAFFLQTERKYRSLYNEVIARRRTGDLGDLYDLNPHRFNAQTPSIARIMRSKTLWPFYLIPVLLLLVAVVYMRLVPAPAASSAP
ncbi:MAG: hypothetical protein OHK0039_48530 [Bacteroidia bacterium]